MVLFGRPSSLSRAGGVAMASDSTPAAWAGTAFMMTELVDGLAAGHTGRR